MIALALPAAAQAAPLTLDGNPLDITMDEQGRLQVRFDGSQDGEFFPSSSTVGNAGFLLAVADSGGAFQLYGSYRGTDFVPEDQNADTVPDGPVFVSGPPGDPTRRMRTVYDVPGARIIQVIEYRDGERQFTAFHQVTNLSGSTALRFSAIEAADLSVGGSDSGRGFHVPGPPQRVGGVNDELGAFGGLEEHLNPPESRWTGFEADNLSQVNDHIPLDAPPALDGSVIDTVTDNAVGVQWDHFRDIGLAPSQSAVFRVDWRFGRFMPLTLDPASADRETGETHEITVTSQDQDGLPAADRTIGYEVTGANDATGSVTTGSDGSAQVEYLGVNPGIDSVSVFHDRNANGSQDSNEPQQVASVNWTGPPAPEAFQSVNVGVVRGTVRVDLPRGGSLVTKSGKRVRAARFVALRQAAQIPLGSKVDTRRGTVRMLSAADTAGNFQTGNFRKGIFRVRQKRAARPVTTLRLRGGNFGSCVRNLGRNSNATTARRRIRRLRGNASGRFRTRGRYGSATVRGTRWRMDDRCNGTLAVVSEGSVRMKDFGRDRTVTVEAGERYLAKRR